MTMRFACAVFIAAFLLPSPPVAAAELADMIEIDVQVMQVNKNKLT